MIDTCVKFLSEFNYQDFKIETSDNLLFSVIPEINEPQTVEPGLNFFILRTGGGNWEDVPNKKYNFSSNTAGQKQVRSAENNGKFVYLEQGKFYAIGDIGSITVDEEAEKEIFYHFDVFNYQEISPVESKTIKLKINLQINQGGITKISKEQFDYIIENAQSDIIKYWQIAPKKQATAWDLCIKKGIIPIYFNDYIKNPPEDILEYSKEQLIEFCQKNNPNATKNQISANAGTIWNFIHTVQIGDYILANKGMKIALGWGVITSKPKIARDESEITIYHDVEWKDTTLNQNLSTEQGKNFFTTMFQMTKEHFNSIVNPPFSGNLVATSNKKSKQFTKQIILYGPPGTGKTYNSILRAHEVIFGVFDPTITYPKLQEKLRTSSKQDVDITQISSWLNAIMMAFHEIKKEKIQVNEIRNSKIIQEYSLITNNHTIRNTIWYTL